MTEIEWWEFDDREELISAVAGDVQFIIESALDARGSSLLALPVDDAAMPVLAALAEKDIKWKYVTIVPTDDLLVPVDDERSHVRKLAELFLTKGARVLPIATENPDYKLAGSAANARLQDLPWPPDLIWLGMGPMGETAGIFEGPDKDDALTDDKDVRAVGLIPEDGSTPRVTLTKSAICQARTVIALLGSSDMQMNLEQAIADEKDSPTAIGQIFANLTVPVDIYVQEG